MSGSASDDRRSVHQVIGRTDDLWIASYLERFGITHKDEQTLWNSNVKGNIQLLDKWAPIVNDCCVLGGVHRHARFELVSVRRLKNLWDFKYKYHVVTAKLKKDFEGFDKSRLTHVDPPRRLPKGPGCGCPSSSPRRLSCLR